MTKMGNLPTAVMRYRIMRMFIDAFKEKNYQGNIILDATGLHPNDIMQLHSVWHDMLGTLVGNTSLTTPSEILASLDPEAIRQSVCIMINPKVTFKASLNASRGPSQELSSAPLRSLITFPVLMTETTLMVIAKRPTLMTIWAI
jgi:hypothetical protein